MCGYAGAGCVRPRLLSLRAGGVLLSGGRQCWLNKTDVLLWAHTGETNGDGPGTPKGMAGDWERFSLSYVHNKLWTGDPALRFSDGTVNTTYGGPHSHFLGTLSYTSLLSINESSAVVTYDLRLSEWHGIPAVQFGFSMRVHVRVVDQES